MRIFQLLTPVIVFFYILNVAKVKKRFICYANFNREFYKIFYILYRIHVQNFHSNYKLNIWIPICKLNEHVPFDLWLKIRLSMNGFLHFRVQRDYNHWMIAVLKEKIIMVYWANSAYINRFKTWVWVTGHKICTEFEASGAFPEGFATQIH